MQCKPINKNTLVSKSLKLIFIDYKYGRIWYQCKGNDMRIFITLIPNKKKSGAQKSPMKNC